MGVDIREGTPMRTQNPQPLKACRFDSDLGHHIRNRSTRAGEFRNGIR